MTDARGKTEFNPNRLTFAEGLDRIKTATGAVSGFTRGKIVTSRDPAAEKASGALKVNNVPGGFTKYQLPVAFERGPGAQFFISIGNPDVEVASHSHEEGDGMRFIISGSIIYDGKELTGGDWMFIPKGVPYSFTVGRRGVVICYCYQCCCA